MPLFECVFMREFVLIHKNTFYMLSESGLALVIFSSRRVLLLTVFIEQHFASHQDRKLEVEFGYTTTLALPVCFFPVAFRSVVDGLFSHKDGTNKQVPKILPKTKEPSKCCFLIQMFNWKE